MKRVCSFCNLMLSPDNGNDGLISHGICPSCYNHAKASLGVDLREYLDMLDQPVIIVDSDVHVLAANKKFNSLTGKEIDDIIGHIGGEVFECENAVHPDDCGKTVRCSGCVIRNSVTETYTTGNPVNKRPATLFQITTGVSIPFEMFISTRKAGNAVLLQIEPQSINA